MSAPQLLVEGHCPQVAGHGFECQACEAAEASGHVRLGGPVVMAVCRACAEQIRDAHAHGGPGRLTETAIGRRLLVFAGAGQVDLKRGGPGPAGLAPLWHGDHYDPLPDLEHADS